MFLTRVDLRNADLRGADLRGSIANGADLRWAWLAQADLRRTALNGAQLRGAHLAGADRTEPDVMTVPAPRQMVARGRRMYGSLRHAAPRVQRGQEDPRGRR
ncbi:MAG: pentapeptide repeat-containing protein [Actinoallomurus sp.]